jgi:hypothetical protein
VDVARLFYGSVIVSQKGFKPKEKENGAGNETDM